MTVRNPSELARLDEERKELYNIIKTGKFPDWVFREYPALVDKGYKSVKQALVKEIWRIEALLGIPPTNYSSSEWGKNV